MNNEFLGGFDIQEGIFLRAIALQRRREYDDGWVGTEDVEETKGR